MIEGHARAMGCERSETTSEQGRLDLDEVSRGLAGYWHGVNGVGME